MNHPMLTLVAATTPRSTRSPGGPDLHEPRGEGDRADRAGAGRARVEAVEMRVLAAADDIAESPDDPGWITHHHANGTSTFTRRHLQTPS